MPSSSTADTTVSCKERFGCEEPLYNNTPHCVLHLPSKEKGPDFTEALNKRLRDGKFDFRGVWFPEIPPEIPLFKGFTFKDAVFFRDATFSGETDFGSATFEKPVTFRGATFIAGATFGDATFSDEANFSSVKFKANAHFFETKFRKLADFTGVIFEKDANFYYARLLSISRFSEAAFNRTTNFDVATFQGGTNFNSAVFAETVNFRGATFRDRVFFDAASFKGEASFLLANFKDYVRFKGPQIFSGESLPKFRGVIFDKPELVSFHSLTLRPHWFVDVNASELALTNVVWDWPLITIDGEICGIAKNYKGVRFPSTLLGIACWNLAVNAEENRRYEEASKFRYLAMEARRRGPFAELKYPFRRDQEEGRMRLKKTKLFWKSLWGSPGILHWLYWLLSGYGERIVLAFVWLIVIFLVFGGIYATTLRDKEGSPLRWRALSYSADVMMLQKPEPPATGVVRGIVILETILGPVQAALLALAIRRKFMR